MPEGQRACRGNVGIKAKLRGIERVGFGISVFPKFVRVLVYGEIGVEIEGGSSG
jgi:hypothetical protein